MNRVAILFLLLSLFFSCHQPQKMRATITKTTFGETQDGQVVDLFTLKNEEGSIVQITNYGGIITSIRVPDRKGILGEVVLGFDGLQDYLERNPYFGCITGRYANRIANGKFSLQKDTFNVTVNTPPHSLHGGKNGFDKKVWTAKIIESEGQKALQLSYLSPDGEEGFPGNLNCVVTYSFHSNNELVIDYRATTDKETVLNLTNHSYFNLKDGGETTVLAHELRLHAAYITPTDDSMIPIGQLLPVQNTPFNFTEYKPIGKDIEEEHPQITQAGGYDHNYVIDSSETELKLCAEVVEPSSGRTLTVLTTEPGVQLYTANWLEIVGRNGIKYQKRSAFCLETQHYPDAPNQPKFPSTTLSVGEVFQSRTIYRFGVLR